MQDRKHYKGLLGGPFKDGVVTRVNRLQGWKRTKCMCLVSTGPFLVSYVVSSWVGLQEVPLEFFTGLETLVHVHYDEQLDSYEFSVSCFREKMQF